MSEKKPSPVSAEEPKKPKKKPDEPSEKEFGGFADQDLPEPTRYGDWEVKGRCSDFELFQIDHQRHMIGWFLPIPRLCQNLMPGQIIP